MAELQRVLRDGDVHAVFQPVINLEDGAEVGLEAFTRGPDISVFHLPRVMFSVGREAGLAGELDRLCRHSAFEALAGGIAPRMLFVNTTADSLVDPDWWAPETLAAMRRAGLDPSHVVLEVNESSVAENPDGFRDAIDWLRSVGYRLSLDDVGSSQHTSLIVEKLRPEFLKFDLTLVRGIEGDQLRRELVRSLVQLAQRAGATLIAERIESEDERRTLIECGARWGQGYLFAAETSRTPVAGVLPRPRVEL
jgi:EAL domain-containing protein (putative c-di-GMP-specific phosphodiesterase class I)